MNVSVVIPTVGRSTLARAVGSALTQTTTAHEVIVVADTDRPVDCRAEGRVRLLRNEVRIGPAASRQRGIDAATGSVIALLDDDDEWHPDKLRRQLAAVAGAGPHWVASSRVAAVGPGQRRRVWPRRLIGRHDPVADYLFRFSGVRHGGRLLQTSTLTFPAEVARAVRWDAHLGAVHDEPSWLLHVAERFPDLQIVQLPEVLSTYYLGAESLSRQTADITDAYIYWGLRHLGDQSARVRGDYLCSSPVSAAVAAGSLGGIGRSVRTALRHGRPGPAALAFAALSMARVLVSR